MSITHFLTILANFLSTNLLPCNSLSILLGIATRARNKLSHSSRFVLPRPAATVSAPFSLTTQQVCALFSLTQQISVLSLAFQAPCSLTLPLSPPPLPNKSTAGVVCPSRLRSSLMSRLRQLP